MNDIELSIPTPKLVSHYNLLFYQDARYGIADEAITKLFQQYPNNHQLDEILLKVSALNSLYNTNIYNLVEVAKHIHSINPDRELALGDLDIVGKIAFIET